MPRGGTTLTRPPLPVAPSPCRFFPRSSGARETVQPQHEGGKERGGGEETSILSEVRIPFPPPPLASLLLNALEERLRSSALRRPDRPRPPEQRTPRSSSRAGQGGRSDPSRGRPARARPPRPRRAARPPDSPTDASRPSGSSRSTLTTTMMMMRMEHHQRSPLLLLLPLPLRLVSTPAAAAAAAQRGTPRASPSTPPCVGGASRGRG